MRISDWSSDVCSSDLRIGHVFEIEPDAVDARKRGDLGNARIGEVQLYATDHAAFTQLFQHTTGTKRTETMVSGHAHARTSESWTRRPACSRLRMRSEERRVGKECVSTCRYGGS